MQKLIFPINKAKITAGYKNEPYKERFKFTHYGIDLAPLEKSHELIYSLGDGEVCKTGMDHVFGNVVSIVYDNVLFKDGTEKRVFVKFFHLSSIMVKRDDKVTKDTVIGVTGMSGMYSTGIHLHLEADVKGDTVLSTRALISNSNIVVRSPIDKTIDPILFLHIKKTAPDNQDISLSGDEYCQYKKKDLLIYG